MATNINFNKILGIAKNSISIKKSSVDPDAQAFITAAAITDTTQQSAINTLVTGLKTDGLWTKMKAIYPFVGGTATTHKFNLKDPRDLDAAFRLVFNGGWIHSSTGALPNEVNGYADSKFIPSAMQSVNSNGLGFYGILNTSATADPVVMGSFNSTGQASTFTLSTAAVNSRLNGNLWGSPIAGASGQYDVHRTGVANTVIYKNGTSLSGVYNSGGPLPTFSIYLGTLNLNGTVYSTGWTRNQFRFTYFSEGLNSTEVSNLRTRVQAFQTTLGRSIGTQTVSDADAQAFVTAANIQDQVQAQAINDLTIGMKADGTWSKMKAIYPFVGGTATSHKYNLKDPRDLNAAFRLTFSGGWTHDANGAKPNGTNGFADTFLTPSANLSLNSTHLSYYSRTNVSANQIEMGVTDATKELYLLYSYSGAGYKGLNTTAVASGTIFTPTTGLLIGNRPNSTTEKYYWKGTLTDTITRNSIALSTYKMYLGCYYNPLSPSFFYSTKQCAFSSIGDGLTDTDAANLYTRVQAFQTTLSRNI